MEYDLFFISNVFSICQKINCCLLMAKLRTNLQQFILTKRFTWKMLEDRRKQGAVYIEQKFVKLKLWKNSIIWMHSSNQNSIVRTEINSEKLPRKICLGIRMEYLWLSIHEFQQLNRLQGLVLTAYKKSSPIHGKKLVDINNASLSSFAA